MAGIAAAIKIVLNDCTDNPSGKKPEYTFRHIAPGTIKEKIFHDSFI